MARRSLELTAQQRAGLVALWLSHGERLTVAQLAAKLKLSEHGARDMLRNLAQVLPIEDRNGQWQMFVIA